MAVVLADSGQAALHIGAELELAADSDQILALVGAAGFYL